MIYTYSKPPWLGSSHDDMTTTFTYVWSIHICNVFDFEPQKIIENHSNIFLASRLHFDSYQIGWEYNLCNWISNSKI